MAEQNYIDMLKRVMQGQQPEQEIQPPMRPMDQMPVEQEVDRQPARESMQEEIVEAQKDVELEKVNEEAKSPNMKTKPELMQEQAEEAQSKTLPGQLQEEMQAKKGDVDPILEQYKNTIEQYKKKMAEKPKEPSVMDALPDILSGLYNIGVRANPTGLQEMQMPNSVARQREQQQAQKQQELGGLQNLQKMYQQYAALQQKTSDDDLSKRDRIYFQQARERLDMQKERLERQSKREGRLREKFDYSKGQKFEDDARNALKDLRQTDTWKTGEKAIAEIETIETLLDDAYQEGGQSLAMLGPKIAKGIAGEVGVLTEQDVKRYVKNPALAESMMDTAKKVSQGKLTETSYENLKRLMEISKATSQEKIRRALDREATLLSRRENIPYEEARYYLDNEYEKGKIEAKKDYADEMLKSDKKSAKSKPSKPKNMAGKVIKSKGKIYRVAEDGETLIPLE